MSRIPEGKNGVEPEPEAELDKFGDVIVMDGGPSEDDEFDKEDFSGWSSTAKYRCVPKRCNCISVAHDISS